MSGISVAASGTHLLKDGRPFVPLADTVWNAFAEVGTDEWIGYLRHRRAQGFNGLLISTLPVLHDRSINPGALAPFAMRADGGIDFSAENAAYWSRAEAMAEAAVDAGFVLFLVVLWSCYVPGSPANQLVPHASITRAEQARHIDRIVARFGRFDPVLLVSGDDPLTSTGSIEAYGEAADRLARQLPSALRSFHTWPEAVLPPELVESGRLDFITVQSGHLLDFGARAIAQAEAALSRPHRRPVMNLEPCYEGHGHVGASGRFSAAEVRRVLWTGCLAGLAAGFGYGAHGIWQWHRAGSPFLNAANARYPFPWEVALRFEGADDAALLQDLVAAHRLYDYRPAQGRSGVVADSVRVAEHPETGDVAVYAPSSQAVALAGAFEGAVEGWDLSRRVQFVPRRRVGHHATEIEQPDFNGDFLILLQAK